MPISTKPRAETVELAGRLLESKTIDGVTIEDVHHLAARILDDQEYAPKDNRANILNKQLDDLAQSMEDPKPKPPTRAG